MKCFTLYSTEQISKNVEALKCQNQEQSRNNLSLKIHKLKKIEPRWPYSPWEPFKNDVTREGREGGQQKRWLPLFQIANSIVFTGEGGRCGNFCGDVIFEWPLSKLITNHFALWILRLNLFLFFLTFKEFSASRLHKSVLVKNSEWVSNEEVYVWYSCGISVVYVIMQ